MVFSLAIVAGATEETDTPASSQQTVTLNVTCTSVTDDGVATFEISINAPASGVAALQFYLSAEGMTHVYKANEQGETVPDVTYNETTLEAVANLKAIVLKEKGQYGYTASSETDGKFYVYGGNVNTEGRYLSGTTKLMTVQYQLNDGAESGTLKISDFKACQSGDKAIGEDGYTCTAPEYVTATRPTTGGTTLKGDVNGDGVVNSADLTALARIVGKIDTADDAVKQRADVVQDGVINSADLTKLARYIGKIISTLD